MYRIIQLSFMAVAFGSPPMWAGTLVTAAEPQGCDNARKIGQDIRISVGPGASTNPHLVWTGSELGLFWTQDLGEEAAGQFVRLDPTGSRIGDQVSLPGLQPGSVAWNGSGYGIAFRGTGAQQSFLMFARMDALGNLIAPPNEIDTPLGTRSPPSLVWTGSGYGVAYVSESEAEIGHPGSFVALLDAGGEVTSLRGFGCSDILPPLSLLWTGTEYGLMCHRSRSDPEDATLVRFTEAGQFNGFGRIATQDFDVVWSSLAWDGVEFAVAWEGLQLEVEESGVFFTRFGLDLEPSDAIRITETFKGRPSLLWPGVEHGLFLWQSGFVNEISLIRLDPAGRRLDEHALRVHDEEAVVSDAPSVVWTGSGYAVAWPDRRQDTTDIYFARIGCNCSEAEIPGNPTDEDCDGTLSCAPGQPWRNHGEFVQCVSEECQTLLAAGLATREQCQALTKDAARTAVGQR